METNFQKIARILKDNGNVPMKLEEITRAMGAGDSYTDNGFLTIKSYINRMQRSGELRKHNDGSFALASDNADNAAKAEALKSATGISEVYLRQIARIVLSEQRLQEPLHITQQKIISYWLDNLIRARKSGDPDQLAATVDELIEAMSDLLF
jgi:hypothetical protein